MSSMQSPPAPEPPQPAASRHRGRAWLFALITLLIFGLAIYALSHILRDIRLSDVLADLGNVNLRELLLAGGCAAGSYTMLTLYDFLAVRGIGRKLPYPRVALTSFTAFGISHSVGVSSLSGGSVRYRAYAADGLSALEVAAIMTLVAINFFLGVGTILGLSLWFGARQAAAALPIDATQSRVLAVVLFSLVIAYALLTLFKREPIRLRGRVIRLPRLPITMMQLVVSSIDLCFTSACLYFLLPPHLGVGFPAFVGLFVLALQAGVLSNVPGGLGVFESILLLMLPGAARDSVLGGVLLFRVIYYLIPLFLALGLLAGREAFEQRHYLQRLGRLIRRR
jgi:Predicted integral membrane protein